MAAKQTKRRKSTKSRPKKNQQNTEIRGEIIILVMLAVCILLVLSNFGLGGTAGEAVSSVLFGIFGFMAYLLPFAVFGITAFLISNRGNAHAYVKIAAGVVLFLLFSAILELIFHSYTPGASLLSYYRESSRYHNAGGVAGGCIVSLLCPLIGEIGTYVVLIVLSVICVILITEKSLLAPLGRQSKKAYEEAKKKHQETAVIRARRREEERERAVREEADPGGGGQKRKDRKVSGVSFATTLTPEEPEAKKVRRGKKRSPEIYEITPDDLADSAAGTAHTDSFVINRAETPDRDMPDPFAVPAGHDIQEETAAEMDHSEAAGDVMITGPEDAGASDDIQKKRSRRSRAEDRAEVAAETEKTAAAAAETEKANRMTVYHTPPLSLLKKGKKTGGDSDAHLRATALKLEQTLQNFGVGVHVTNASCGPSVTRYELQPDQGVKVSKIVGLSDDIKLNLAVADLRIEAPIPGKAAVGIEVPNSENTAVMLRDLLESAEFRNSKSPITFAVGKDIAERQLWRI